MSTESIVRPAPQVAARPLVGKLHEWVTTVDHKRLGILYITYAPVSYTHLDVYKRQH